MGGKPVHALGRVMHERVDRGDQADRGQIRIEYGLPLKSARLDLTGRADVVEFTGQILPFKKGSSSLGLKRMVRDDIID